MHPCLTHVGGVRRHIEGPGRHDPVALSLPTVGECSGGERPWAVASCTRVCVTVLYHSRGWNVFTTSVGCLCALGVSVAGTHQGCAWRACWFYRDVAHWLDQAKGNSKHSDSTHIAETLLKMLLYV